MKYRIAKPVVVLALLVSIMGMVSCSQHMKDRPAAHYHYRRAGRSW
jgi:hypothetical protein